MTRLFWRLHCKQQTQSTPCVSGFNANLENETAVSVYLDTYIHRSIFSNDKITHKKKTNETQNYLVHDMLTRY